MTKLHHQIVINAARLRGFDHFAAALLKLYFMQWPEERAKLHQKP